MNTSVLKAFAPAVRRDLMEAVSRKLDVVLAARTPDYRTTFAPQVAALAELARADRAGLVERVAYTWFNRLAALRYLDARGWHPFRARVLTAADAGSTQPELLKLLREGALPDELARHTDPARLDDLLDGRLPSPNPQAEVYRHLVLAASRYYHALLPDLFERLDDATELLLPDDLLTEQSPVAGFRTAITDEDCADVEVLGWLYQFYISEKKDAVMARRAAVPSEDIPAVTQLFTPHWIVRYLVENSLGRLWLLNRPGSRLREQMSYYVETEPETDFLRIGSPEEIRVLDPAVGSGHMLTYAFDLLYAIYEEEGYAASEIPGLILRHNLYGIDIDPRAAQLAQLALVLKARERSRRFFQPEQRVQPNVIALKDVRFERGELREYVRALDLGPLLDGPVLDLLGQFEQATTFGSLIQPVLGTALLADLRRAIEAADVGGQLLLSATHHKVLRVLDQAEYLTQRYHTAVTNPPYLGGNQMTPGVKTFAREEYADTKADLFAMFIARGFSLTRPGAYNAMITMQSWMFLSSYESMRSDLLGHRTILVLAHLGARGFDSIGGEVVQTVAFVCTNRAWPSRKGVYVRLTDGRSERDKAELFREALNDASGDRRFLASSADFQAIPGSPIAYWLSPSVLRHFAGSTLLADRFSLREGINTGNNDRFLRYWYEVESAKRETTASDGRYARRKWVPHKKGGAARRWFGNADFVLNWESDGREIHEFHALPLSYNGAPMRGKAFFFKESLSWSRISTGDFAIRYYPAGYSYDSTAPSIFVSGSASRYLLGLLNSRVSSHFLAALCPTLDYRITNVGRLPLRETVTERHRASITELVDECVSLAKADLDSFETSWGFRDLPVLRADLKADTLAASWEAWRAKCLSAVKRMQQLETENNRLLISVYELDGELVPEVPEEDVGLGRADQRRDATAFLSYAVGCTMGRYSLDKPGLVLADTRGSFADFIAKIGRQADQLTFTPDMDGVIPFLDGEWFEDDVVARIREFLRATFGEATLRENVRWLEESLGKDLRKYFLTGFYKDHLQTYRKRPIYWLVQSPKKGFAVLIYLHRYTRDTLNVVLNRYLREYQGKLRSRLAQLAQQLAGDTLQARDRTAARKEQDRLTKVLHECEEWERQALLPLAQQRIALDLDDGVKVNYLKLADVLAPIPGLAVAEA